MDQAIRLDKWLWAARFFKTRPLATAAVSGGKVHLNGQRVKPGRSVQVGDTLQIQRAGFQYGVAVIALADRRGPASVAQTLYLENEASIAARAQLRAEQKLETLARPASSSRPNKQQRRHIIRFKQER